MRLIHPSRLASDHRYNSTISCRLGRCTDILVSLRLATDHRSSSNIPCMLVRCTDILFYGLLGVQVAISLYPAQCGQFPTHGWRVTTVSSCNIPSMLERCINILPHNILFCKFPMAPFILILFYSCRIFTMWFNRSRDQVCHGHSNLQTSNRTRPSMSRRNRSAVNSSPTVG